MVAFATLAGLAGYWIAGGFQESFSTGNEVARRIVATAQNGLNPVPLAFFASKVCMFPEQSLIGPALKRFFPDAENIRIESEASDGIWWLALVEGAPVRKISALAIEQSTLRWDAPNDDPAASLYRCIPSLLIDLSSDPPRLVGNGF